MPSPPSDPTNETDTLPRPDGHPEGTNPDNVETETETETESETPPSGVLFPVDAFLKGADAPTEADSERDGLLSYSSEWHAAISGFLIGYGAFTPNGDLRALAIVLLGGSVGVAGRKWKQNDKLIREMRKEAWYTAGGAVLGAFAGIIHAGAARVPDAVFDALGSLFVLAPTLL